MILFNAEFGEFIGKITIAMKVILKRLMTVAVIAFFSTVYASAQLTTAEPVASKVKGGNRAKAGDFGLYMGITSNMFQGWTDENLTVNALPLLNFKYMFSDALEFRVGLEFYKEKTKETSEISADKSTTIEGKAKTVNSESYLYPGVAYHFAPNNILDVYVGAELPIGWTRDVHVNKSGSYSNTVKGNTFNIGLGAFVGLQAYIADLPFAIGVEYGLSAIHETGLKYKNIVEDSSGKRSVFYTKPGSNTQYSDLSAKEGGIGSQFRLTFTYYFK